MKFVALIIYVAFSAGACLSQEYSEHLSKPTTDQKKIYHIYLETVTSRHASPENIAVERAAFAKLTNTTCLFWFAMCDFDPTAYDAYDPNLHFRASVRREDQITAIQRIDDQLLLFRIATNKPDGIGARRLAAVQKLTNQTILKDIVMKASTRQGIGFDRAPLEAVNRITQQTLLAEVANMAYPGWIQVAAINNITDQSLLVDVVKNMLRHYDRHAYVQRPYPYYSHLNRNILSHEDQMVLKPIDRDPLSFAFERLSNETISNLPSSSCDPAFLLAARMRLPGASPLGIAIESLLPEGENERDIHAALRLVPHSGSLSVELIKRGDSRYIPMLIRWLDGSSATMAEDYYNSGNAYLREAAEKWAVRHNARFSTGNGSNRASWGRH